jgi:hypothetical protein
MLPEAEPCELGMWWGYSGEGKRGGGDGDLGERAGSRGARDLAGGAESRVLDLGRGRPARRREAPRRHRLRWCVRGFQQRPARGRPRTCGQREGTGGGG